ncbi:MAG: hypothetical protein QE271_02970 [Bacteriovoracaceae bacterium]|nr:hypothetical protein [Bacteriovoracaceae bacterium]
MKKILSFAIASFMITFDLFGASLQRMSDINFAIDSQVLDQGVVKYFYEFLDQNLVPIPDDNKFNRSGGNSESFNKLKNLDIDNNAEFKQKNNHLYVGLNKTVYSLNKPISFFSENQICNFSFIKKILSTLKLSENSHCNFHVLGSVTTPSMDFRLYFYSAPDFQNLASPLKNFFKDFSQLGEPEAVTFQYNYNFGNIMFQKTADSSYTLTQYYSIDSTKTLVVVYSMSYIFNAPPGFAGGANRFHKEYKIGTDNGVNQLRSY